MDMQKSVTACRVEGVVGTADKIIQAGNFGECGS